MKLLKTILAYAFLTYVLWTIFLNMTVAGALLIILPVFTVSYFIVRHRERARKAALLPNPDSGSEYDHTHQKAAQDA